MLTNETRNAIEAAKRSIPFAKGEPASDLLAIVEALAHEVDRIDAKLDRALATMPSTIRETIKNPRLR